MPSNSITEINPQSLGPMQQIRPPQSAISIPNPLSVTPFFQASQLLQNKRSLDQNDISLKLREKQQELAQSQLLFQQTKELLDMNDLVIDGSIKDHQGKTLSNTNFSATFGLDPNRPDHLKLIEDRRNRVNSFQEQMGKGYDDILNHPGANNSKDISTFTLEMGLKKSQLKQNLLNDPEYMKYAIMQKKYDFFMDNLNKLATNGVSVNSIEVQRVKDLYDQYTSGGSKTMPQRLIGELDSSFSNPEFLLKNAFNKDTVQTDLLKIANEVDKPEAKQRYNTNVPGAPGQVVSEDILVYKDPTEKLQGIVTLAKRHPGIVNMFKTVSAGADPESAEGSKLFEQYIQSQVKSVLHPAGIVTTKIGEQIVRADDVLKRNALAKATSTISGLSDSNNYISNPETEGERTTNLLGSEYSGKGYQINRSDALNAHHVADLKVKNPQAILEEVQPDGSLKVWQVAVNKDTGEREETEEEKDGKPIGKKIPRKLGDPLLVLPRRKVAEDPSSNAPIGAIKYDQGIIDLGNGKRVVPAMLQGRLDSFRSKVSQLNDSGVENAVVLASESPSSLAEDADGAIGRYQFQGKHRTDFLKSISDKTGGTSNWKEAYDKLGPQEFAKQEDEYYNQNISTPAVNYVNDKLAESGIQLSDSNPNTEKQMTQFIGSMANQSGGYRSIVDSAINNLKNSKETIDSYNLLDELYKERVKYISRVPEYKRGSYKSSWGEVAVNRPYQDYVATKDLMNEENGYVAQDIQGSQIQKGPAQTTTQGQPQVTQNQAGFLNTDKAGVPIETTPLSKARQEYLTGEGPSAEKIMEYLKEAGIDTPTGKIRQGTTASRTNLGFLEDTIKTKENQIKLFEDKLREENKIRIRKGEEAINPLEDPKYVKMTTERDVAVNRRAEEMNLLSKKGNAILVANSFPGEAKQAYSDTADTIKYVLDNTTIDLSEITDDKVEGTLQGYGSVDPDHFSLTIDGKQRDISREELIKFIEQHAKSYAFAHTNPIELARAKEAKSVIVDPAKLSSDDKVDFLRGVKK